jgi:hypothetical protein
MKIKTAEAKDAALDWLVAICEHNVGWEPEGEDRDHYSTNWAQGGPIIERHIFRLEDDPELGWLAESGTAQCRGNTALVAAMRCYVASKLGDEVEIPEELMETNHGN